MATVGHLALVSLHVFTVFQNGLLIVPQVTGGMIFTLKEILLFAYMIAANSMGHDVLLSVFQYSMSSTTMHVDFQNIDLLAWYINLKCAELRKKK